MTTDLLCDGPITKSFLETKLQEFFKTKSKLSNIDGAIISKGLGFMSDVMKVHLTWQPKDDSLPQSLIVKAPKIENIAKLMGKMGVTDDSSAQFVPLAHAAECRAYALLSQHDVVPLPKIYGYCLVEADTPGMLVMEDLADRAGHTDNISNGVTLDQWRNVVEVLADLHGWSLATDVPWRKDFPGVELLMGMMKGMIGAAEHGLKAAKEKYPDYLGHVDVDLILKEMTFDKFEATLVECRALMPDVLTHGDTWVNNIFFAKNGNNGTLSSRVYALIDWQVSLQTSGVNDLTRFASWCVNHNMRREHEATIFRHYYDRLKSKAGDKFPTDYEQAKLIYDRSMAINGFIGVLGADMFLTMIAKVDEDPTGGRRKEMLERIKAGYDDAAEFVAGYNKTHL